MPKYASYWRWIPVRMIQEYDRIHKDKSYQAQLFTNAINRALQETEQLPDGKLRISAVRLVYIKKWNTIEGAAYKLHVSSRTLERYLFDFVTLVAKYAGFIAEDEDGEK